MTSRVVVIYHKKVNQINIFDLNAARSGAKNETDNVV